MPPAKKKYLRNLKNVNKLWCSSKRECVRFVTIFASAQGLLADMLCYASVIVISSPI